MHVAIIGATGKIGGRILTELLDRQHWVTGIARDIAGLPADKRVQPVAADMTDADALAAALAGHDAVISSATFTPGTSASLLAAVRASGVKRYLVVGGAGSLRVPSGGLFVEEMQVPADAMARIREGIAFLDLLRQDNDLDWTFLSPSAQISAGERTGVFRLGGEDLLRDSVGLSRISYEDYAIAMVDELERPAHVRARFTVGY